MTLSINLTKRIRRRELKSGEVTEQTRYVLNWRDPRTGAREQRFFERQKDAQEKRAELVAAYERGAYSAERKTLTVADAVAAWLDAKRATVRLNTFASYEFQGRYVTGPLLPADARLAIKQSGVGKRPNARPLPLLGHVKAQELTTRQTRTWHKLISEEVSVYSANKAMRSSRRRSRSPPRTTSSARRPCTLGCAASDKARKAVLTPDEVARLLDAARGDAEKGVYVAFPFLAGTRPSEQLGLLWEDVDFAANHIHIRRIQLKDGTLSEVTKTAAGARSIPMPPSLREMLMAWRLRCPRKDGALHRVFPASGTRRAWPLPPENGGGALLYNNFRARIWAPALKRLGLPAVTPHSARHSFISTLQAQGVEVGLVAKLAGHKSAMVTLTRIFVRPQSIEASFFISEGLDHVKFSKN